MKVFPLILWTSVAALAACKEGHSDLAVVTTPDYNKGVSFLERHNDSAYYYFNKVVTTSKDSLQIAMAYNNMAVIQNDAGDDYGGQEMALISIRYLRENRERDRYCLVADYNVLGNSSLNLKNYDAAIDYYDRAAALAKNAVFSNIALNNKAVVYREAKQYAKAIALYDSILPGSRRSKKEYARVLTNLAMVRWLKDTAYRAAPSFLMALQIRKAEKDDWGLNSSYSHLADYYSASQPDSALSYARKMYTVACRLGSPDDELEALQKLIMLGPAREVKPFFVCYRQLSDSLVTARSQAKNQFALIRYESEKNKADNLRLQRENAEKKVEIFWQRASIAGFILLIVWLYTWFRRRARNRLRENMLRISRKVHDEVANGVYRVMSAVQYGTIGKEQLVGDLDSLYERSRDISYDGEVNESREFYMGISKLLTSFGGPVTRVGIAGNDIELWADVSDQVKRELLPILQELMVNMEKHSGASRVSVRFERDEGLLIIRYTDDGVGLPQDLRFGNGLTNTENRIKSLSGRFIFDRNLPKGLRAEIHLPIS